MDFAELGSLWEEKTTAAQKHFSKQQTMSTHDTNHQHTVLPWHQGGQIKHVNWLNHNVKVRKVTTCKQNFQPEYVGLNGEKEMHPINLWLSQDLHEMAKIMNASTSPHLCAFQALECSFSHPLRQLEFIHYASYHSYTSWRKKSQFEDVYVWGPHPSLSPNLNSLSLPLGSPPLSNNSTKGRGNLNKVLVIATFL